MSDTIKAEFTPEQYRFALEVVQRAHGVQMRWGTQPTAVEIPLQTLIDNGLGEAADHGIVAKIGNMLVIPVDRNDFAFAFLMPNNQPRQWWGASGASSTYSQYKAKWQRW